VFDEISLLFNKGVNIIIGENNSGKTTIIDALRICPDYGKSDTNIYIQESDLHLNPSSSVSGGIYELCGASFENKKSDFFKSLFLRYGRDSNPRPPA
jgi:predicted ATP-dependent endonuclease of OLD family